MNSFYKNSIPADMQIEPGTRVKFCEGHLSMMPFFFNNGGVVVSDNGDTLTVEFQTDDSDISETGIKVLDVNKQQLTLVNREETVNKFNDMELKELEPMVAKMVGEGKSASEIMAYVELNIPEGTEITLNMKIQALISQLSQLQDVADGQGDAWAEMAMSDPAQRFELMSMLQSNISEVMADVTRAVRDIPRLTEEQVREKLANPGQMNEIEDEKQDLQLGEGNEVQSAVDIDWEKERSLTDYQEKALNWLADSVVPNNENYEKESDKIDNVMKKILDETKTDEEVDNAIKSLGEDWEDWAYYKETGEHLKEQNEVHSAEANMWIGVDAVEDGNYNPEIFKRGDKFELVMYGKNAEWKGKGSKFNSLEEAKQAAYKQLGYEFDWQEDSSIEGAKKGYEAEFAVTVTAKKSKSLSTIEEAKNYIELIAETKGFIVREQIDETKEEDTEWTISLGLFMHYYYKPSDAELDNNSMTIGKMSTNDIHWNVDDSYEPVEVK